MKTHPIKAWREKRGISAVEFARTAEISVTSLCRVERGERNRLNADACRRVVEAFPDLDLGKLLGWEWK